MTEPLTCFNYVHSAVLEQKVHLRYKTIFFKQAVDKIGVFRILFVIINKIIILRVFTEYSHLESP